MGACRVATIERAVPFERDVPEVRTMKRFIYKLLRLHGDANAVAKGKVGRRIGRRVYGKATGRLARKWFG